MVKNLRYVAGSIIELFAVIFMLFAVALLYVRDGIEWIAKRIEAIADIINILAYLIAGEDTKKLMSDFRERNYWR